MNIVIFRPSFVLIFHLKVTYCLSFNTLNEWKLTRLLLKRYISSVECIKVVNAFHDLTEKEAILCSSFLCNLLFLTSYFLSKLQ